LEQEKTKQRLEQERLEKERLEQQRQKEQQQKKEEKSKDLPIFRDILFPLRSPQKENPIPSTSPSTIPSPSSSIEDVVYPFEQKLQDLSTMGFSDRKKNILALIQNKGDIQLAIEQLLNSN